MYRPDLRSRSHHRQFFKHSQSITLPTLPELPTQAKAQAVWTARKRLWLWLYTLEEVFERPSCLRRHRPRTHTSKTKKQSITKCLWSNVDRTLGRTGAFPTEVDTSAGTGERVEGSTSVNHELRLRQLCMPSVTKTDLTPRPRMQRKQRR